MIQSGTALFGFMQLSVNAMLRKTYTENVLQQCMFDLIRQHNATLFTPTLVKYSGKPGSYKIINEESETNDHVKSAWLFWTFYW